MRTLLTVLSGLVMLSLPGEDARACTNFLISRGASSDGSTMITYAADSVELYGELYYTPGAVHRPGAMREIIEWDTGKRLGEIPQVPRTYSVVGLMNEHQLAIGETTFGGREELRDEESLLDYGSLMFLALERARTAREAIGVMTSLAEKYGFYSHGESFSISDPQEVWILEMVGKGKGGRGALWAARRVPDGYVSAHANQARIKQIPLSDKRDTMYAKDVISFARDKGWFKGKDKEFSFADTYAPMTWQALRICEARVWSFFRRINRDAAKYLAYVKGEPGAEPMPLWIKPDRKLSVHDTMELMRDHYEGTPFDLHGGLGAGPFDLPYRWRPLTWYADPKCDECKKKKDKKEKRSCLETNACKLYINDRPISTQQTGFSFVAQSRKGLPDPIGGVLWFGVDDTASTVYVPMYAGVRQAPYNFRVGTADFRTFSWDSAFWVFNFVSNFAYSRYRDMIKDVRRVQRELEGSFMERQPEVEKLARSLYATAPEGARDYLTQYSAEQARRTTERYRRLLTELLLKYLDGNVRDAQGKVVQRGYPKEWLRRIVKERGKHFESRKLPGEPEEEH